MAIKQRTLMKLNTTKHHMSRGLGTGNKAALSEVCRNLTETRDLYREGLPQQNYVAYGEICDGLILAVRKMMEDGEADVQGEVLALCQELLEHLEKETEKEQHFKKEIFFLPYKADMWDSLESVWKVAYEDKEHCNAYVMPIPYADRNTDGSIAEWHCERDRFPKYVPTLDWREIDLKAWHPDVIFFHSPYDDCNLVTSVESRYYSRKLKECTDKLVYIPYFVLGEPCTEESVENFVLTPGVLNADKVVVQSEAMRELYINILTKKTNRTDRAYWEECISGAGSPKIEKVLTSKKEDFDMPEKWRKLAEGRKVILYNTSLGAMLQNSDKVCDKLRYVFDVFRNRDDVVLWWRPHPLMKATFHSMRPQFEEEYLSLEKRYIEEGWGIYDDSPDLHRAICWSDAYYGDASSVVSLYKQAGKHVVIESFDCGTDDQMLLAPFDITLDENMLYFTPCLTFDVLCIINIDDCNLRIIPIVNAANEEVSHRFGGVIVTDKEWIMFPMFGNEFVRINRASCDQKAIKFDKAWSFGRKVQGVKFTKSFPYHNKVFLCTTSELLVLVYDKETDEFRELDLTNVDSLSLDTRKYKYMGVNAGEHLFILIQHSNIVLDVDMDTERIKILRIGSEEFKFECMDADSVRLMFVTTEHMIVEYNYKNNSTNVLDIPSRFVLDGVEITNVNLYGKKMYVYGRYTDKLVVYIAYDLHTHAFEKSGKFFELVHLASVNSFASSLSYFAGRRRGYDYILLRNEEKDEFQEIKLKMTNEQINSLLRYYTSIGQGIYLPEILLENVISHVLSHQIDRYSLMRREQIGKKIYEMSLS